MKEKIKELMNKGLTNVQIAEELKIPYNTVKSHARRIKNEKPVINDTYEYGHCKYCGKEVKAVEGKREKLFCSSYCRLKYWRAKKNGK